jgi:hypothetical protein
MIGMQMTDEYPLDAGEIDTQAVHLRDSRWRQIEKDSMVYQNRVPVSSVRQRCAGSQADQWNAVAQALSVLPRVASVARRRRTSS